MTGTSPSAGSEPVAAERLRRALRSPLTWILLIWVTTRLLEIVFCIEGLRNNPEEGYIGAAGSFMRRNPGLFPIWTYQYSPYEGGSLWVNAMTGAAQAVFGENLFALKVPPLLLGAVGIGAVYAFLDHVWGRVAAAVGGLWMLLPPPNVLVEELKNDGLHYDSTGFSFLGLLLLAHLARGTPSARHLLATGAALGLICWFSYQSAPFLLAGGLAWILARPRGEGSTPQQLLRLARELGLMGVAGLVALSPHLHHRAQLGTGVLGLYTGEDKAGFALRGPWSDVLLRPLEVVWVQPFHEANFRRALPFDGGDLGWIAAVVLGSILLLALLERRAFVSCARGLLLRSPTPHRAAFGAPWLVLFPLAYAIAVEGRPVNFSWYYYPLYPAYAAAGGALAGALWLRRDQPVIRALAAAVGLGWLLLFAGHLRGTRVVTDFAGPPELLRSRGANSAHLSRFWVWNHVPNAASAASVRDEILQVPEAGARHAFFNALGHSLLGRWPEGLLDGVQGWDRVGLVRGWTMGRYVDFVGTPSIPNRWTKAQLGPLGQPPDDDCTRVGRAIGVGAAATWELSQRRRAAPEPGEAGGLDAWYWFGAGISIGGMTDKDVIRGTWFGHGPGFDPIADLGDEAGPHAAWAYRGVGWAIGQGGVLVRYRELPEELSPEATAWMLEGLGMARAGHLEDDTAETVAIFFGPEGVEAFERGLARHDHPDFWCSPAP